MGYSTNRLTLEAVRPLLNNLEEGLATEWRTQPGKERYWAYKIREALYIAKLYSSDYPALASAADHFKIEILGPGLIGTRVAGNTTQPTAMTGRGVTHGVDTSMRGSGGELPSLLGPQTADTIIEAWTKAQPSNDKLYFPDAALSNQELLRLYRWCGRLDRNLLFFESEGAITLQRATHDLAPYAWNPTDLEEPPEIGSPAWFDSLPTVEEE